MTMPAKELYKCSNCGQGYKSLPTASYPDGAGKGMFGRTGCTSCGAGQDAILKLETDRDAL